MILVASVDEPWQTLATAASFICIYGLAALLPKALALPVPISNITQCRELDRFIITTAWPHGISGWFRPKIVLWGTGSSYEKRVAAWEVRVLNSVQLLLCDEQPFPGSLESSQGFCRLVRPGCMIWASVLGVPLLLAAVLPVLLLCFFFHFNPQLVLAAPATLLALCMYVHRVIQTKNPLHQRIQCYRERMKKTYSATEIGDSRSVHLRDLQDFYSTFDMFIGQRNLYYIASNIIKPLTQPLNLSFAEMAGPCAGIYISMCRRHLEVGIQDHLMNCLGVHAVWTRCQVLDVCIFDMNQLSHYMKSVRIWLHRWFWLSTKPCASPSFPRG